jgi:hypothetical protein
MNKKDRNLESVYMNMWVEGRREDLEGNPGEKFVTSFEDLAPLQGGVVKGVNLNDIHLILSVENNGVLTSVIIPNPLNIRLVDAVDVDGTQEEVPPQDFGLSDADFSDEMGPDGEEFLRR